MRTQYNGDVKNIRNIGIYCQLQKKSQTTPTKLCTFLGFEFDTKTLTLGLPQIKQEKIRALVGNFEIKNSCKIRELAQLLGLLTSACPAVPYGWAHTKRLERAKYLALRDNPNSYNRRMKLTPELAKDFSWWHENIKGAKTHMTCKNYKLTIYSDSSKTGWGAVCGDDAAHGFWNVKEQSSHINILELQPHSLA